MDKTGFEPIVDENSEILILGTFPSEKSLEKSEYYGHKVNQFWKIISDVCCRDEPQEYSEKTGLLLQNRFALWDVYGIAVREGSADANIQKGTVNDFNNFFKNYPNIKGILFGSKRAETVFRDSYAELYNKMPHATAFSPSSAYPKRLSEKKENWRQCISQVKELIR